MNQLRVAVCCGSLTSVEHKITHITLVMCMKTSACFVIIVTLHVSCGTRYNIVDLLCYCTDGLWSVENITNGVSDFVVTNLCNNAGEIYHVNKSYSLKLWHCNILVNTSEGLILSSQCLCCYQNRKCSHKDELGVTKMGNVLYC